MSTAMPAATRAQISDDLTAAQTSVSNALLFSSPHSVRLVKHLEKILSMLSAAQGMVAAQRGQS